MGGIEDGYQELAEENERLKHESFLNKMSVHGITPVKFITSKTLELFQAFKDAGYIDCHYSEFMAITEPLHEGTDPVRWYGSKASLKRVPELLANDKSKNATASYFFKLTDKVERKYRPILGKLDLEREFEARNQETPKTINRKDFKRNVTKGGDIQSIIERFILF